MSLAWQTEVKPETLYPLKPMEGIFLAAQGKQASIIEVKGQEQALGFVRDDQRRRTSPF